MTPDGWIDGKVQDVVASLESGVSVNGQDRERFPGEKAVLKVSAVSYGTFDPSACKVVTAEELDRAKVTPKSGQIIISRSNTEALVGASAYIENDHPNLFLPDKLWQTVPKPDANMKWLSYVLSSEWARYTLSNLSTGTSGSMKNITKQELLTLSIKIPPSQEQSKIAQILSTWDKAITTTEQLLANSQHQKLALKHQLLTGKKRLPAHTSNWKLVEFKDLLAESRTPGTTGDISKKLTVKLYGQGVIAKNEKRAGSESTKYFRRKAGQFIYSKLDFLNGAFGIIPEELDGFESTLDLPAFDFESHVDPDWFINFVSRPEFYAAHLGLANGGRKARRVNPKDLLKLQVPIPDYTEQRDIALVLTAADKTVEAHRKTLEVFRSQKKALMQQLLTGKRRVKVDAEQAA